MCDLTVCTQRKEVLLSLYHVKTPLLYYFKYLFNLIGLP